MGDNTPTLVFLGLAPRRRCVADARTPSLVSLFAHPAQHAAHQHTPTQTRSNSTHHRLCACPFRAPTLFSFKEDKKHHNQRYFTWVSVSPTPYPRHHDTSPTPPSSAPTLVLFAPNPSPALLDVLCGRTRVSFLL